MTARREEVGTASGGKADEEEGGLSSALLYSQTDSERPIGTNSVSRVTAKCRQRRTVEKTNKTLVYTLISMISSTTKKCDFV